MKKFAALFLLMTTILTIICASAFAEDENGLCYMTCEQVEVAFEERFGYKVNVSLYKGLPHDPEALTFRIPNYKGLGVYYLRADAYSEDGSEAYVSMEKLECFFKSHEISLTLYPWENLSEYMYYDLEEVADYLFEQTGAQHQSISIETQNDDSFIITVNVDGVKITHEFGSAWKIEADVPYFHQGVITKLFEDWHKIVHEE